MVGQPPMVGRGWRVQDRKLEVVSMEHKVVHESTLELISWNCHQSARGENWQCQILSLECPNLCNCSGNCDKVFFDEQKHEEDEGSDEDEEYDSE